MALLDFGFIFENKVSAFESAMRALQPRMLAVWAKKKSKGDKTIAHIYYTFYRWEFIEPPHGLTIFLSRSRRVQARVLSLSSGHEGRTSLSACISVSCSQPPCFLVLFCRKDRKKLPMCQIQKHALQHIFCKAISPS